MVADFRRRFWISLALSVPVVALSRMIQEWLGDWRTYLADRERYVVALEADPAARFYVSEKDRRQVTEPIDFFAGRANEGMDNCVTPGDLA